MSPLRRGVTARQLIQALQKDGFALSRTRGSHRIYHHPDGRRVVLSYHSLGGRFPVGTLRAIIADAGWTEEDLERLGLAS